MPSETIYFTNTDMAKIQARIDDPQNEAENTSQVVRQFIKEDDSE